MQRLVLVDSGAPLPLPPGIAAEVGEAELGEAIAAALGPAYARPSMTFESAAKYQEMWRAHPSFTEWNGAIESYVEYDLVLEGSVLRPACRLEGGAAGRPGPLRLPGRRARCAGVPAVFLRAERGMFDDAPLYPPGYAARWLSGTPEVTVAGVNHYTITLGPRGVEAVAAAVA